MSDPSNSSPAAPRRRRSALPVFLVLLLVVLVAGGWWFIRSLRTVAIVEPVVSAAAIDAKPGSVTVEEDYALDVKSEQPGRILEKDFNLRLGQEVHKGQVLLRLDPTDLQLQLDKLQIDYDTTLAKYKADHSQEFSHAAAVTAFANAERAHKIGTMSEQDFEAAERSFKANEQSQTLEAIEHNYTLKTDTNSIAVQKRLIEKMTLTAPVDGFVKAVIAHPGELINANTAISTLITVKKNVVGKISDENFAEIKLGQDAVVTFIPYGNWLYHGKVTQILPTTDPQTQRHIVYLDVTDIDREKLIPGINGELAVTVGKHQARTVVPRRAVFSTDGENVYVVKDGVVHLRHVKEGYVWSKGVEITDGLEPGENVIVESLEDFRDGDRVSVETVPSDVKG